METKVSIPAPQLKLGRNKSMTNVSIIIANWNGLKHLQVCLNSVFNQSYKNFEVVFIDNASTDDSVNFVKQNFSQVKVIKNNKNFGFAEGYNIGIREALKNPEINPAPSSGVLDPAGRIYSTPLHPHNKPWGIRGRCRIKFVACLNNDTEVEKNWLSELIKAMEGDSKVGLCASKILYFNQRDIIDSAGDFYYKNTLKIGPRGHLEKDKSQYNKQEECLSACAGAVLYKREMLEDIRFKDDFFDSDYFAYIEDSDLSLRARFRGWKCIYVPTAIVYHKVGATTNEISSSIKKFYSFRNRLYTTFKIYPVNLWLKSLKNPVTYQESSRNLWKNLWLYFKVIVNFLVALPKLIRKRLYIQGNKKVDIKTIKEWSSKLIIPTTKF